MNICTYWGPVSVVSVRSTTVCCLLHARGMIVATKFKSAYYHNEVLKNQAASCPIKMILYLFDRRRGAYFLERKEKPTKIFIFVGSIYKSIPAQIWNPVQYVFWKLFVKHNHPKHVEIWSKVHFLVY